MHLRTGEAVVRVFRNKGLLRHHPLLKSEGACARLGGMRMQNKWGIILLVLLPLLMCFSGCKEEREPELVMATDATFPPYEYFKGDEIVGVDVDVVA